MPHTDLMKSFRTGNINAGSAALAALKDAGLISGSLDSGSVVSISKLGRIEFLRAKQERRDYWRAIVFDVLNLLLAIGALVISIVTAVTSG